jgi:hypothetical protein
MRCRPYDFVDDTNTKLAGNDPLIVTYRTPATGSPTEFILNTNNIKSKGLMIGNLFLLILALSPPAARAYMLLPFALPIHLWYILPAEGLTILRPDGRGVRLQ